MKFEIKKGDTFSLSGPLSLKDRDGNAVDLSGWSVASEVRFVETGQKVRLTTTWLVDGQTVRVYAQNTSSWLVGLAEIDIEVRSPGPVESQIILSTKTRQFSVTEDLTNG